MLSATSPTSTRPRPLRPELLDTEHAHEISAIFESGELQPDSALSGEFVRDESLADVDAVMDAINDARAEALITRQQGREAAAAAD